MRPKITEVYCLGILRLKDAFGVDCTTCISPEDKTENKEILSDYKIDFVSCENKLGPKKNFLLNAIMGSHFDYLMELNSDDIVKNELITMYEPFFHGEVDFFGIDKFTYVNSSDLSCKAYHGGTLHGIGRCYSKTALQYVLSTGPIWPDKPRGMDLASEDRFLQCGIESVTVEVPVNLAYDIKSDVNIWKWEDVEGKNAKMDFTGLSSAEIEKLHGLRTNN